MQGGAPKFKLFINLLSQPARMVLIFCELAKIPYEKTAIALEKGEQKTEAFLKVNPNGVIPALQSLEDPSFSVFESTAILRYINNTHQSQAQKFWPQNNLLVEEFFQYYHTRLRKITEHFRAAFLWSIQPDGPKMAQRYSKDVEAFTSEHLDTLGPAIHKFTSPNGTVTIIDIVILCEVMQLNSSGFPADKVPKEFKEVIVKKFAADAEAYKIVRDLHIVVEKMCAKRKYAYWLEKPAV